MSMSMHIWPLQTFVYINWGRDSSRGQMSQYWTCARPTYKYTLKGHCGWFKPRKSRGPDTALPNWDLVSIRPEHHDSKNAVRAQDKNIQKATSSYIDDVFINESIISSQAVKKHFQHFGLTCKESEPLQDGAKVLGLHVSGNRERLCWRKGGDALGILPVITHHNTFFLCVENWWATFLYAVC